MTMDDPTTALVRDAADKAVILAVNLTVAQEAAKEYGVSVQCQLADATLGIAVVTSLAEAQTVVAALAADTPWCLAGTIYDATAYTALAHAFGAPVNMSVALGVTTSARAWRNDTFRFR